jgi:hypothetical protein
MERDLVSRQNTHRSTAGEISNFPRPVSESRGILEKTERVLSSIDEVLPPVGAVIFDIAENRAEKVEEEFFLSPKWLAEEVAKEKQKTKSDDETPWYHLAGTGFYVKEQVSQLLRNTKETSAEIVPDILEIELSKVKVDMEAFEHEYLKQMASLTWNLEWKTVNGQERIICPDYGDVLWESVTDKKEREGAVYETLFGDPDKGTEGVEGWLRTAPPDSFAVIVSSKGWSGMMDANNQPIVYPESQVYAIKKLEDGSLQAYTFRYDANISQNETLQRKMGLHVDDAPNHRERIKMMDRNVAFIKGDDPERKVGSFEDIVSLMQESVGGRAEASKGKPFEDIFSFLQNPEKYSTIHPLTTKLIKRFQEYAKSQLSDEQSIEETELNLQIAQAISILQMNRLYREEEQAYPYHDNAERNVTKWNQRTRLSRIDYVAEKVDLGRRPGCAPRGGSVWATSMGSSRAAILGGSNGEGFTCPECGYFAKVLGGDVCPREKGGCGTTKQEFALKNGQVCM